MKLMAKEKVYNTKQVWEVVVVKWFSLEDY